MESERKLQPNTTQIPHIIIREWLPLLTDTELRVLLIVADQTLGWIENAETGKRKERDWISQYQMQKRIQRSERAVRGAIANLVDNLGIIQALKETGEALDSPEKRKKHGGKIYYRLNLHHPQKQLFPLPEPRQKVRGLGNPGKKQPGQKGRATKETLFTKVLAKAAEADQTTKREKSQEKQEPINRTTQDRKTPLPTTAIIAKFKRYAEEIRKTTPQFERGKDGNLIKAALKHLNEDQLELQLLWFLTTRDKMATTLGAALCKESLEGYITATRNEQGFYLRMTELWREHNKTPAPDPYGTAAKLQSLKQQLAERLARR
jgi:hypothetical protein